jgi:myo-inositol-1(or 4)-monophosphatase
MEPTAHPIPVNLRELALKAARSGAEAIAEVRGGLKTDAKQASHDLVTSADRASEQAVLQVLRSARPDDAVLGEERGEHPGTTRLRWLVDPLDGTANFIYGRAGWSVSVGAEIDGQPAVGAVVCPADGRWAAADPGGVDAGGYDALPGLVAVPRILPAGGRNSASPAEFSRRLPEEWVDQALWSARHLRRVPDSSSFTSLAAATWC